MSWSYARARHFRQDGRVDVKAEMDDLYTRDTDRYSDEVIASSMVGSTYYAAVRTTDKETGAQRVWAGVAHTRRDSDALYDFGFKDMSETSGPVTCDCPARILDLLSPTDSESALRWRERCRESASRRAFARSVMREPVGTKVRWVAPEGLSHYRAGETVELTVAKVGGQRALVDLDRRVRVPTKLVTRENTLVVGRPSNESLLNTMGRVTPSSLDTRSREQRGGEAR